MYISRFRSLFLAAACALLLPQVAGAQGVPPLINYQGRIAVGGTNFNGSGAFKFALVDAAGGTTYIGATTARAPTLPSRPAPSP